MSPARPSPADLAIAVSRPRPPEPAEEGRPRHFGRLGEVLAVALAVGRFVVGALLSFHYVTGVLVVGWVFRLMRLRILRGWWQRSAVRDTLPFATFAERQGLGPVTGLTPNWVVSEPFRQVLNGPGPDGAPARFGRKLLRLPRALFGALGWNLRRGLAALACTYVLTTPACFLWLAAWFDGWNTSFTKGYEHSSVGFLTGALGSVLFIAAMMYVPMAWAHLAATGDLRAFFQFGFVWRLIRNRLADLTLFAFVFSAATLPLSILRAAPYVFTQANPGLEADQVSPETVRQILTSYYLACAALAFVLFVATHLLVARIYRKGVLSLLRRDPAIAGELHPRLHHALNQLELLPAGLTPRRHPLVAVIVGTGRLGTNALLWVACPLLWFTVVAQVFVVAFLNFIPWLSWMNQPLIHLPTLLFIPPA